jgi:hypothetical protein
MRVRRRNLHESRNRVEPSDLYLTIVKRSDFGFDRQPSTLAVAVNL